MHAVCVLEHGYSCWEKRECSLLSTESRNILDTTIMVLREKQLDTSQNYSWPF